MDNADCIMCVSELTRQTVINQYHQDPRKCFTVHNAVYPLRQELQDIPRPDHTNKEKVVTFLGRITIKKDLSILLKLQIWYYIVQEMCVFAWLEVVTCWMQ